MTNYLALPLFSDKMKEILLNLIMKKKSVVCITLNHVLQNIENEFLRNHEEFKKVESLRMLDFRKDNDSYVVSYLALGKEPEYTERDKWSRKNRQQGKIGKIIKNFLEPYASLIGIRLTAADIEEFVNDIKAALSDTNLEFRLVKGDDIRKYYLEDNYATFSLSNPLHNSCMKHGRCQSYFDIYTKNPDCEMLLLFDKSTSTEKIVARAIVWNKDGQKYVDRRYFMLDMYHTSMIEYVKQQGWMYKEHNTYDDDYNCDFMGPVDGKYIQQTVTLTYDYGKDNNIYEFPYSDTVKYWDGQFLSNSKHELKKKAKVLRDTGGDWDLDYEYCCACCDEEMDENDAIYCENYDNYYCRDCVVIDYNDEYVPEDYAIHVVVAEGESVWVDQEELSEVAVNIDGTWYMKPGNGPDSAIQYKDGLSEEEVAGFIEDGWVNVENENLLYKPE